MSQSPLHTLVKKHGWEKIAKLLSPEEFNQLSYCWELLARPEQIIPDGNWRTFLALAGRRFGKTRMAAEGIRSRVESGAAKNLMLVAPTHNDLLTDMLYGQSGIITISPPDNKPEFRTTDNTLNWKNGARAICLSAEKPERTRGKEVDTVWCDEIAAWRYPETWDLLQFCGGNRPMKFIVTTTPRPTDLVKLLVKTADIIVRGKTVDNASNLDPNFLEHIITKYQGTRLGRQELDAEILEDMPGALWNLNRIDSTRIDNAPTLNRIVVAVDPSGGSNEKADEQGIVVVGIGQDNHTYVLDDRSCKLTPDGWGAVTVKAYQDYKADRIVVERNYGGDMAEHVINTAASAIGIRVPVRMVSASRGKVVRAEPVAALYEQSRVHHVGVFKELEDQMCHFSPMMPSSVSPDRVDALVWAVTDLNPNHAPIKAGATAVLDY